MTQHISVAINYVETWPVTLSITYKFTMVLLFFVSFSLKFWTGYCDQGSVLWRRMVAVRQHPTSDIIPVCESTPAWRPKLTILDITPVCESPPWRPKRFPTLIRATYNAHRVSTLGTKMTHMSVIDTSPFGCSGVNNCLRGNNLISFKDMFVFFHNGKKSSQFYITR